MSVILEITATLLEDMHAGSGLGLLGQIDSLQARDPEGNPVIRASTLRGVLRDTAEEWIRLLERCGENPSVHKEKLARLLGVSANQGEQRAEAVFQSLRMVKAGRAASHPFLVWSTTARAHGKRTPKAQSLRQIEHARAGLAFRGTVTVPTAEDAEWMQSCLKRITAFGGRRTRGSGEFRLTISRREVTAKAAVPVGVIGPVLRLLLRLEEPLNLAKTGIAGNLIPTEKHIPGPTVRGALLHWLAGSPDQTAQTLAERLGNHSGFTVSPGFLLPESLEKKWQSTVVMPLPLSLEGTTIHTQSGLPWWAGPGTVRQVRDLSANPPDDKINRWKRIRDEGSLALQADGQSQMGFPLVGVLMRNQVPRRRRHGEGEDVKDDEALFTEEVLLQEQLFLVELRVPEEERQALAQALGGLVGGEQADRSPLRMGRGSRPCRVIDHACGNPPTPATLTEPGRLTVTLLSHLLARTPWLTFASSLTPDVIGHLVKHAGGNPEPFGSLQLERMWADVTTVSTWNRATRRSRAPAHAIRMGSVFVFSGEPGAVAKAREALRGIEALGERVPEGYGRFVLDLAVHHPDGPGPLGISPEREAPASDWREEVLARVDQFVAANLGRSVSISRSQWQSMRHMAAASGSRADLEEAVWKPLEYHLENTRAGRDSDDGKRMGAIVKSLRQESQSMGSDEKGRYFLERTAAAFAALARKEGGR